MKVDGTNDKYEARIVVKGYKKRENLDYFDTYSPIKRIISLQVLTTLTIVYDLQIHQMDFKTTFLNGDIDEEIYMDQPEGSVTSGKEKKVWLLVK